MGISSARRVFVDGPGSLGARARERRWKFLGARFPDLAEMQVLDLGGTAESWIRAPIRPRRVHLVNTVESGEEIPSWITSELGDACALDEQLLDGRFDLVYSNSVIEHVGGHARRLEFASMVDAAAPRHWVQTPYRYFPIEPHWVAPMMQFLPLWLRSTIGLHWPLVHTQASSFGEEVTAQLGTELLGITHLRHYFPSSEVHYERFAGLVKSIIAVRADAGPSRSRG